MLNDGIKITKPNNDEGVDLTKLDESQAAAVTSTAEKVILRAPAGSGKTTSIINAIIQYRYENLNDRICAITYTRAARAEMEARLQEAGIYDVEVTTIHVGARNLLNDFSIKYNFKVSILEEMHIKAILKDIISDYCKKARIKSINEGVVYSFVTGNKNMDVSDRYRSTLMALERRYIAYKRNAGLYDFTDYPLYLYDVLVTYDEQIKNIDALFIDEFQDVDSTQFKIFEKVFCKKKFAVGDPGQCQPAGTKIGIRSPKGGLRKNIEDVQIGDPVVFYDQSAGQMSGEKLPHNATLKKVTAIQEHEYYNDYLITITTEKGLSSSYTSNHRTFVRFNRPQDQEKHVVYLMCDSNNRFRVGKIPLFYTGKTDKTSNPGRDKMRAEGCVKIWLLKVFDTDHEARVEETKISYLYQIPQTCGQLKKVSWTQEDIDYIYENLNTYDGATRCLKDYQLDIRYPLLDETVEWSKRCHFTSNASSEIYAINLISNFMTAICFGSETSHKYLHGETIIDVKKTFCKNPIKVYALGVEDGTYVADGIATHNSIFVFRGADGEVFEKVADFNEYKLQYNYRSYQEIIDYAATVYTSLLPLVEEEKTCYISMILDKLPSGINCVRGEGGYVYIADIYGRYTRLYKNKNDKVSRELVFNDILSRRPMILCRTNKQVAAINALGYFECSTVHQAKGLEYDNVIVIDSSIDNLESLNVAYVALTRAKNRVFVINGSDFEVGFEKYIDLVK